MAQPFDAASRTFAGDPFPAVEQVGTEGSRYASFSMSPGGTLAHARGGALGGQLTWRDRTGKIVGTVGDVALYSNVALSPDEKRLVVSITTGSPQNRDIWTIDVARNVLLTVDVRSRRRQRRHLVTRWIADRLQFDESRSGRAAHRHGRGDWWRRSGLQGRPADTAFSHRLVTRWAAHRVRRGRSANTRISGSCRCSAIASQSPSPTPRSSRTLRPFLLMAGGSPTHRTNRERCRCTCSRSRQPAASTSCRRMAAASRYGERTVVNMYFLAPDGTLTCRRRDDRDAVRKQHSRTAIRCHGGEQLLRDVVNTR